MERSSNAPAASDGDGATDFSLDRRIEDVANKLKLKRTDVKKVLKTVLTDDDVLEFFRSFVDETDAHNSGATTSRIRYEPKLTRRKFRELLGEFKPGAYLERATRKSLLEAEFPDEEEEEDDEFRPEPEDINEEEEDQDAEGGACRTEEVKIGTSGCHTTDADQNVNDNENDADDADQQELLRIDDDQIALRTRSRCNLSHVPVDALALRAAADELEAEGEVEVEAQVAYKVQVPEMQIDSIVHDEAPVNAILSKAFHLSGGICGSTAIRSSSKFADDTSWDVDARQIEFDTGAMASSSKCRVNEIADARKTEASALSGQGQSSLERRTGSIDEEVEWHKFLSELGALNGGPEECDVAASHDELDDALLNNATQTQHSAGEADVDEQDDPEFDPFAAFDERDIDELVEELRYDRATRVSKRELATLFDEHLENADDVDADAEVEAQVEPGAGFQLVSTNNRSDKKLSRISEQTRSRIQKKLEEKHGLDADFSELDGGRIASSHRHSDSAPHFKPCSNDSILTQDTLVGLHVEMKSSQIDELTRQLTMYVQQLAQTVVLSSLPKVATDTDNQFAHAIAANSLNELARRRSIAHADSVYNRLSNLDGALAIVQTQRVGTAIRENDKEEDEADWRRLASIFLQSDVFKVPELLPTSLPRVGSSDTSTQVRFSEAEDCLIAYGLAEFRSLRAAECQSHSVSMTSNVQKVEKRRASFNDLSKWSIYELISKRYLPTKTAKQIEWHVHNLRSMRRSQSRLPCRSSVRRRLELNPIRHMADFSTHLNVPHAPTKSHRVDPGSIIDCRDKMSRLPYVYRKFIPYVKQLCSAATSASHDEGNRMQVQQDENAVRGFESDLTLTNLPNTVLEVEAIDALIELSNVSVFLRDIDTDGRPPLHKPGPADGEVDVDRAIEIDDSDVKTATAGGTTQPDLDAEAEVDRTMTSIEEPQLDAEDCRSSRVPHTEDDLDTLYARLYVSQLANSLPVERYGQVLTLFHTYYRLVLDAHERYLQDPSEQNADDVDSVVCELVNRFEQLLLTEITSELDLQKYSSVPNNSTDNSNRTRLHRSALFCEFGRFLTQSQASKCGLIEQHLLYHDFAALLAELKPLVSGNPLIQTRFVNYAEKIEKRRLVPSTTLNAVRTALKRIAPKSESDGTPRAKSKRQRSGTSHSQGQSLAEQFRDIVGDERMSPTKVSYADSFCHITAFDEVHLERLADADRGPFETVRLADYEADSSRCCDCDCHQSGSGPSSTSDHCAACGLTVVNGHLVYRPSDKSTYVEPVELVVLTDDTYVLPAAPVPARFGSTLGEDCQASEYPKISPVCYDDVDVIQANDVLIFNADDVHVEEVRLQDDGDLTQAQAAADSSITEWTRTDDALILDACQRVGTSDLDAIVSYVQYKLAARTPDQVRQRVATLLALYASI